MISTDYIEQSHRKLSDIDQDGRLTFMEFTIAMQLIFIAKLGYILPVDLDPNTILPPSVSLNYTGKGSLYIFVRTYMNVQAGLYYSTSIQHHSTTIWAFSITLVKGRCIYLYLI